MGWEKERGRRRKMPRQRVGLRIIGKVLCSDRMEESLLSSLFSLPSCFFSHVSSPLSSLCTGCLAGRTHQKLVGRSVADEHRRRAAAVPLPALDVRAVQAVVVLRLQQLRQRTKGRENQAVSTVETQRNARERKAAAFPPGRPLSRGSGRSQSPRGRPRRCGRGGCRPR